MRLATHRRCAAGTRDKSYPPPLTRLPWGPGVEVAVLVPRHGPFIRPSPCTPRSSAWLFEPGLTRRALPSVPDLVAHRARAFLPPSAAVPSRAALDLDLRDYEEEAEEEEAGGSGTTERPFSSRSSVSRSLAAERPSLSATTTWSLSVVVLVVMVVVTRSTNAGGL